MPAFRRDCSPLWEPFTQVCFELNVDMDDADAVDKAWEMWFAGFTGGVVNASSPRLGKLTGHFDPRIERHALGEWSVLSQERRKR